MNTRTVNTAIGLTQQATALEIAQYSEPKGASKQTILAALVGIWNIYTGNSLSQYKLQQYITSAWLSKITGQELYNRIASGCITATKDNCTYAVIYHKCTPSACFKADNVMLSYRNTVLGNFVLVRPALVVTPDKYIGIAGIK
jgi:hypothetical protein